MHYKEEHLNLDEWCCIIYTFKNAGKTHISMMDNLFVASSNFRVFPTDEARSWAEGNLLNYVYCYDKQYVLNSRDKAELN